MYLASSLRVVSDAERGWVMSFKEFFDCLCPKGRKRNYPSGGKIRYIAALLNSAGGFTEFDEDAITEDMVKNWLHKGSKGYLQKFRNSRVVEVDDRFDETAFILRLKHFPIASWQEVQTDFLLFSNPNMLDLHTTNETEFYQSLAKQMHSILGTVPMPRWEVSSSSPPSPGELEQEDAVHKTEAVFFTPSQVVWNGQYVAREQIASDLHEHLINHRLVALWGLAGLGKSEISKRYYLDHAKDYDHHVFLTWSKEDGNISAWQELFSNALATPISTKNEASFNDHYQQALVEYRQLKGSKLLVIDALPIDFEDEVIKELASLNADILLSSRRMIDQYFKPYALEPMNQNEAVELFCIYAQLINTDLSEKERRALDAIITIAGRHPLTIELIARVQKREHLSLVSTLAKIEQLGFDISRSLIKTAWGDTEQATLAEHLVKLLSLYEIEPGSSLADILSIFAVFPALPLSLNELGNWLDWTDEMLAEVSILEDLALLKWQNKSEAYAMHQVLAEAVRHSYPIDWGEGKLGLQLHKGLWRAIQEERAKGSLLTRHQRDYLESLLKRSPVNSQIAARLAAQAGSLAHFQADYVTAIKFYSKAVDFFAELGESALDQVEYTEKLAYVYFDQGKIAEAELFLTRVLKIRLHELGAKHPQTAQTYADLAAVYDLQENYAKALEYSEQANAIRMKEEA